jgi:hypothetical protein
MTFLSENQFDFGRCFSKGISYINIEQERLLRSHLDLAPEDNGIQVTSEEDAAFVSNFL